MLLYEIGRSGTVGGDMLGIVRCKLLNFYIPLIRIKLVSLDTRLNFIIKYCIVLFYLEQQGQKFV